MSVSGNPRSRGWLDAIETDTHRISSPKIFPNGPQFHDGLEMSNRPQRTLLPEQELQPHRVSANRYLSASRINHKVPVYVTKRKMGRARSYIGRRAAIGGVYKTPDVMRSAAVGNGKDHLAPDEYGGDARGRVPVDRIDDRIMNDVEDNGGETGIQNSARMADVKQNGGLRTAAHDCRGLNVEQGENGRELGIKDYAKEIHVGREAAGKNSNGKVESRSFVHGVGLPMSFGASGKLMTEAKEKRSGRDFGSYFWTGIDPAVSDNRKGRSLRLDFGNGNSLPWKTTENQPPEWKGHYLKVVPNDDLRKE